jgi:serine/threonine protein kinase
MPEPASEPDGERNGAGQESTGDIGPAESAQSPAEQAGASTLYKPRPPTRQNWPRLPGYDILAELGRGGMGVVYRARDLELNRLVAVKMIRAEDISGEHLARFRMEAEAVARLRHPHIVQIYSTGSDAGRPFFVMEHLEGGSLARRLQGRPQPPREAARLVLLLARAVHAAHQEGILHRDLKPHNVLLAAPADEPALNTAWGYPKVADFGLAKHMGYETALTAPGNVVGTPAYMAPEQLTGRRHQVGPATDVYGLGAILFELLTGHAPVPPLSLGPASPPELDGICRKSLAPDPDDRYPTAAALAAALDGFLREQAATTGLGRAPDRARPRFRRAGVLGVAAVALVLLGLVVAFAWRPRPDSPSAADTARPKASASLPVKVLGLDVRHIANVNGRGSLPRGILGQASFTTHVDDWVTVQARLSQPAYAYLICFRPDGTEELCYPGSVDEPPPRTDQPRYPAPGSEYAYGLNEGAGLEVLALVASSRPLPAYKAWRPPGPSPWKHQPAVPGVVWWDDGAALEGLTELNPRGKGRRVPGRSALAELTDWLRRGPGVEAVAALGFAVESRGKHGLGIEGKGKD